MIKGLKERPMEGGGYMVAVEMLFDSEAAEWEQAKEVKKDEH